MEIQESIPSFLSQKNILNMRSDNVITNKRQSDLIVSPSRYLRNKKGQLSKDENEHVVKSDSLKDEVVNVNNDNKIKEEQGASSQGKEGELDINSEKKIRLGKELTPAEQEKVEKLKKNERDLIEHEQAHFRAGGCMAYPPQYFYTLGPDGNHYAVMGRTRIGVEEGNTPRETIEKARIIKRAALAPRNPSPQDLEIAAKASQMEAKARKELVEEEREKVKEHAEQFGHENKKIRKPFKHLKYTKILGMKVRNMEIDDPYIAPSIEEYMKNDTYREHLKKLERFYRIDVMG